MQRLSSPPANIRPHYAAVVVGSGYGAGVAASRLARAKRSVCVLERGREFMAGEFPDTLEAGGRAMQLDAPEGHVGSATGLFDFPMNKAVDIGRHGRVRRCPRQGADLDREPASRPDHRASAGRRDGRAGAMHAIARNAAGSPA